MNNIMQNDLEFLRDLKNYSLESKLLTAQKFSSRLEDVAEISRQNIMKQNISPFEIETFTVFSIIYNSKEVSNPITETAFINAISL